MGKFSKPTRSYSDKKKPSFKSKGGAFKRDKDSSERSEKKDNDGYKEKRSFTKSKDYKNKEGFKKSGAYDKSGADKEKRPFSKSKEFGGKKSFDKSDYKDKRPFSRDKKSGDEGYKEKRSFDKDRRDKDGGGFEKKSGGSFVRKDHSDRSEHREKRAFSSDKKEGETEKLSYKERRSFTKNKEFRQTDDFKKKVSRSFGEKKEFSNKGDAGHKRPFLRNDKYKDKSEAPFTRKPLERKSRGEEPGSFDSGEEIKRVKHDDLEEGKGFSGGYKKEFSKEKSFNKKSSSKSKPENSDGLTRLNKYLANAGIASRRDADILIKSGVVKVNGVPITEMGHKIKPGDIVTYGDAAVKSERKVYLLLNKPKDYITTMDDPQERKTVMALVGGACKERIYPVGRLDRNTTGLLLFTNDGELTKKLTHPKHEIKKVYHVSLNKSLRGEDFKAIVEGVELEDGLIKSDDLAFVGEGKKEVGIEIHSGRNRIVRRLFEHLGYEILKLDRVTFAGLTKKDLPRGKHRFLTQKEVNFLQMIG